MALEPSNSIRHSCRRWGPPDSGSAGTLIRKNEGISIFEQSALVSSTCAHAHQQSHACLQNRYHPKETQSSRPIFFRVEEDIPLLAISSFLGYPDSSLGALFQSDKTAQ